MLNRTLRPVARAATRPSANTLRRAASTSAAASARRSQWRREGRQRTAFTAGPAGVLGAVVVGAGAALASVLLSREEEGDEAVAHAAAAVDWKAVRADIVAAMDDPNFEYDGHGSYGPVLVRLAWHSSGTADISDGSGGSNGAHIRLCPEKNHGANAGLGVARDLLEPIKEKHPGLSYADLYTFAGKVAIEELGGPEIDWAPGRSDAVDGSTAAPDGRLPDAAQGAQHVRDIFYRMGFNDQEIVALAGAHALGRCHSDRSGYDGPWTNSPTTFSNEYFVTLKREKWRKKKWGGPEQYEDENSGKLMMLPADMAFLWDSEFRKYVDKYAEDNDAFSKDFASAFSKLLSLNTETATKKKKGWLW